MAIKPKMKMIPGKSAYIAGVGFILFALGLMYDTYKMGSAPEPLTPESAVSAMQARKSCLVP